MNNDEKLKMLLHPEDYTLEELDQMLDEEAIDVPDSKREWRRFHARHTAHRWRYAAAASLTLLLASGLTAASVLWYAGYEIRRTSTAQQQNVTGSTAPQGGHSAAFTTTDAAPVVFEDRELQDILQYVAEHYQAKVEYKNDSCRHVRFYLQWQSDDTLNEVVEHINHFNKVHITQDELTLTVE